MELSRRDLLKGGAILAAGAAASAGVAMYGCSNDGATSKTPEDGVTGVFEGVGAGRAGNITLNTYLRNGSIVDIEVTDSPETATISEIAISRVSKDIIRNQSIAVDAVTGATLSSMGVINAVKDALESAGADLNDYSQVPEYSVESADDCSTDVVIVGGGVAGMNAAIEVLNAGKSAILVEKQDFLGGGDSMFGSTGFMAGGGFNVYRQQLENCTEEDVYNYMVKKFGAINPDLENMHACTSWGGALVDFYISIGVPLTRADGKTFTNYIDDGSAPGTHFVKHLSAYMDKIGLDYRVGTKMTSIIMDGGDAAGVVVEDEGGEYTIKAKAVIIASGSFTQNKDMVIEYCNAEKYADLPRSCTKANTGDGQLAAEAVGAKLANMSADYLKLAPYSYVATNGAVLSLTPIAATAALVNDEGCRFVNEFDTSNRAILDVILDQPNQAAWGIFDQKLMDKIAFLQDCNELGYLQTGSTWEELASAMELNGSGAEAFVATMEKWQATGAENAEEDFGAIVPDVFDTPPYYAARVTPAMQGAYCGIATDSQAHVINMQDQAIPGLYAAGVVSGHGCPPTAGLSLSSSFGRIAGQTAVAELA